MFRRAGFVILVLAALLATGAALPSERAAILSLKATAKIVKEDGRTELVIENTGTETIRYVRFRPEGYGVEQVGWPGCRASKGEVVCDNWKAFKYELKPGQSVSVTLTKTDRPGATGGGKLWVDDDFNGDGWPGHGPSPVSPWQKIVPAKPGGCDVVGTAGNDVLKGTPGDDRICGLGGNDRCTGGEGDDTCTGGPGNDSCDGGLGNDRCIGGPGDDTCDGGPGNDSCDGGPGNDSCDGGLGNDRCIGGPGLDTCDGKPDPADAGATAAGFILNVELSYTHPQPNPGFSFICMRIVAESGAALTIDVSGPGGASAHGSLMLKKKPTRTAHGTFTVKIFQPGSYRVDVTATAGGKSAIKSQVIDVPPPSQSRQGPFGCSP